MLFKPELRKAILEGRKTQTRRIVKPGEDYTLKLTPEVQQYASSTGLPLVRLPEHVALNNIFAVRTATDRLKWQIGNDYAVCYGRDAGCKPFRIRITAIYREDVRNISHADALAEGFDSVDDFLTAWRKINRIKSDDAKFYDAWVLHFELAGGGNE